MDRQNYPQVPFSNKFMQAAYRAWRDESTEVNHPTGCAIVKNGKIITAAGNQAKVKNKLLQSWHKNKNLCVRKILKIPSGRGYWVCPLCATHQDHAESLAAKNILKLGLDAKGGEAYLFGHFYPCEPCLENLRKVGVEKTYVVENAPELFTRGSDKIGNKEYWAKQAQSVS